MVLIWLVEESTKQERECLVVPVQLFKSSLSFSLIQQHLLSTSFY